MKITCVTNKPMDENTYICYDEANNNAVIIDPGFETDKILAKIENLGVTVVAILLTHGHFDHVYNIDELKKKTSAPVWAHSLERAILTCTKDNGSEQYLDVPFEVHPDSYFEEGERNFGGIKVRIIHTPGHTQGSCCFLFEDNNIVITGDTLFHTGIGRSDFATGNHAKLIASIRTKLLTLPSNTVILPGHGGKTTVDFETNNNPYIGGLHDPI